MANPLPDNTTTGTLGELLVQLRLLEYGIQAAPPIKDSGNDLIAIKGRVVKFVQVKTSNSQIGQVRKLPNIYDVVILVELTLDDNSISLDRTTLSYFLFGETIRNRRAFTKDEADIIWR